MSIIRSPRKDRGFTVISNSVAQDSRLSMRALGLLVRLLSRPDNWETNSTTLAREFDVGREQMQGVLRELASFGYMELVKHRQTDGTFISRWYVYDEPKTGEPEHGEPAPENPYAGEPVGINKNLANKESIQTPIAPKGADVRFAKLWDAYPKKIGKDAARRAFDKRKVDDALLNTMLEAIARQKKSVDWLKDAGQYIPHPATWLNQGRWQDEEGSTDESAAYDWRQNPRFAGCI